MSIAHCARPLGQLGEGGVSSGVPGVTSLGVRSHSHHGSSTLPADSGVSWMHVQGTCDLPWAWTSEMDTRDPMPSVTTETRREGGGGASGQKTKGNIPAFVAVSPQALGRAVSVPSQGSGLSDKSL